MLSSATSTAPSVIPNPSSSPPLLASCSPPPTSTSLLQLVDISVASTPLKHVKSTSPSSPHPPMVTTSKTPSSKSSFTPLSKAMSPPVSKPICPPLPEHQPSSVPKGSSTAMSKAPPRPSSKPLSPPLRRPPTRPVSKIPIISAGQAQKPTPPSISILEKLIKTCPVWLQLGMTGERAIRVLKKESPGIFLVRRETGQKLMVVSVRLPDQQGEPQVQELHVKEDRTLLYLDGSVLVFDNIFKLIAFYCISRDILPFTLKLPEAILKANKYEDMEVISSLGLEFWSSSLNSHNQDHLNKSSEDSNSSELSQLSTGHLWYINPIFIEEYHNSLPTSSPPPVLRSQSLNIPVQACPKFKRPPPLPPRPFTVPEHSAKEAREELASEESSLLLLSSPPPVVQKEEVNQRTERERTPESNAKSGAVKSDVEKQALTEATKHASHGTVVINRITPSENQASEVQILQSSSTQPTSFSAVALEDKTKVKEPVPVASLESFICLDDSSMAQWGSPAGSPGQPKSLQEVGLEDWSKVSNGALTESKISSVDTKKPGTPVPPPRKKRTSQIVSTNSQYGSNAAEGATQQLSGLNPQTSRMPDSMVHKLKVPDVSLFAPEGGVPQAEHDSNSTSSMEEEVDPTPLGTSVKRKPTIVLDLAKQRLSKVNLSTVFTSFMNTDSKLQKRIVELARDGSTYFGNLVQDYRAFTLDTMQRHSSSTEMLQEIRQMMTQLKSYLIQSTELQSLQETSSYSEDKLEMIIEAAVCKSVLKPLKEAIYNGLKDIHSRAGTLKKLKEHQQIVLGTTTTDLGVKTCVPDSPVIEKIQLKMGQMHQEYSPQKKIDLLLKTCKIIYDSMSVGCPGKAHGADDFLPVLMYVLVRCNMTALLLDVEYMMELMDPVLQLGEGSYYLTTTYGALEHIKNYDKQTVSRQLSLQIQDSIHQWERRRTLNKARASRSSIQDFINISFMEACANTKTLGVHPNTTALELCAQCAEKFQVLEPDSYCLCVLVDGQYRILSPEEFPLTVKSSLHHSEPRQEYYFVYRHGHWAEKKPDENTQYASEPTAAQEDSLI